MRASGTSAPARPSCRPRCSSRSPTNARLARCRLGVMEMSHRGKEFTVHRRQAEADLRELMGIPANYRVLFLQGGRRSSSRSSR